MSIHSNLYSRLFAYRQRENNTPLENFLTELFAYCLDTDKKFRDAFLKSCLKISAYAEYEVSTQNDYEKMGRPDIELELDKYYILIENKVDSAEGLDQLNRYSSILRQYKGDNKEKIVVFLTKLYEQKQLKDKSIKLIAVRWHNIHDLISSKNNETTRELKKFLTENNMNRNLNFSLQNVQSIKTIPEILIKMDELLNRFKKPFKEHFGGFSPNASRSSGLSDKFYQNYVELSFNSLKYRLNIGFNWYEDEPGIWIALEFSSKLFKTTEVYSILDKELHHKKGWAKEDTNNYAYYYMYKNILEFDTSKEAHVLSMEKYLNTHLMTLLSLRKKYPKLFIK